MKRLLALLAFAFVSTTGAKAQQLSASDVIAWITMPAGQIAQDLAVKGWAKMSEDEEDMEVNGLMRFSRKDEMDFDDGRPARLAIFAANGNQPFKLLLRFDSRAQYTVLIGQLPLAGAAFVRFDNQGAEIVRLYEKAGYQLRLIETNSLDEKKYKFTLSITAR